MKLLITGCGHSGTRYLAKLLTEAGFDAGHEKEFGIFGSSADKHDIEVSWLGAVMQPVDAVLAESDPALPVLHVIRDPIKVIDSFYTQGIFRKVDAYADYVRNHIDLDPDYPEADYWLKWNELAESIATRSFNLEGLDINAFLDAVAGAVGEAPRTKAQRIAAHRVGVVGETPNKKHLGLSKYKNLSKLKAYAERFGYTVDVEPAKKTKPKSKKVKTNGND